MVEGQGGVKAIVSIEAYRRIAKPTVSLFPPTVVEHHGFGQARGTGRINVEQRITEESLLAGSRVLAGAVLDFAGQVLVAGGSVTRVFQGVLVGEEKEIILKIQVAANLFHGFYQLLTNNGGLGFHQIERMDQYFATLGGIDQRSANAHFGTGGYGD